MSSEIIFLVHLFEEILVVRVAAGPERDRAVGPELAGVGVDEDGHEAVSLGEAVHVARHAAHRVLVLGVPRDPAEVPELELDGGHLGGGAVGRPLGGVAAPRPQVHVGEWDPRGGVEGREQSVCKEVVS